MTIDDYKKLKTSKRTYRIKMEKLQSCPQEILSNTLISGGLYYVKKAHSITQKYFNDPIMKAAYKNVLEKLQKRYQKTTKPDLKFYNKNILQIAVHIRRGDVANGNKIITKKRFMENQYFYKIMFQMENLLLEKKVPYQFHIFSEGTLSKDFEELHWITKSNFTAQLSNGKKFKKPIQVHLNGDPMESLHHLVSANVIVMAKSCYSYIAGMLNPESIKIYTKFWFKPVFDDWIIANENSTFDTELFIVKIFDLLKKK
jgi:hypothetical protein